MSTRNFRCPRVSIQWRIWERASTGAKHLLNVFVNQKVAKSLDSWPGFMDPGLDFKCRILPRQKWNVKCKFFTDSVWRALRWKALPVFPLLSRVWQWRLRQSYPSPLHLNPAKKSVKFIPLPFLLKEKKKRKKNMPESWLPWGPVR